MNYSRDKLKSLNFNTEERDEITKDLLNRAINNEKFSLAEEQYICRIFSSLRNSKGELSHKIEDLNFCKNYRFKLTYLQYHSDLNGHKEINDIHGLVSYEKKREDVSYLESQYDEWNFLIESKPNNRNLISFISQETIKHLNELEVYCNKIQLGSNLRKYFKKSLILQSKYIYLIVEEAFQEFGVTEKVIVIDGTEILINEFFYVHTMLNHYAKSLKEYLPGKSYHFDETIDFRNIPVVIKEILECFKKDIKNELFNKENIFVMINDSAYAIWFKKESYFIKGNIKKDFYRVQTFYPIEKSIELSSLKEKNYIETDCGYNFWV